MRDENNFANTLAHCSPVGHKEGVQSNHDNFSEQQIQTIRDAFGSIQTVDLEAVEDLRGLFHACSDKALVQLAKAKIKWVSKLAVNACVRRGLNPF